MESNPIQSNPICFAAPHCSLRLHPHISSPPPTAHVASTPTSLSAAATVWWSCGAILAWNVAGLVSLSEINTCAVVDEWHLCGLK